MAITNRVDIHHSVLSAEVALMGFNNCRKAMQYVHRRAKRGALGGPYSTTQKLSTTLTATGPVIIPTTRDGSMAFAMIWSPLDYAASVEAGAKIHPIFPKGAPHVYRFGSKAKPLLAFVWHGRLVITPHVPMGPRTIGKSHPGQKGKFFLMKALVAGAVRFGFTYTPGPVYLQ